MREGGPRGRLQQGARATAPTPARSPKAPENLVNRNFHADEPNRLWLTDITGFRLRAARRSTWARSSNCFDGMPVGRSGCTRQAPRELEPAQRPARPGRRARTTHPLGPRRHYRWPGGRGSARERAGQGMSAKGCSPDNSACEGFFGRLKERVLPLQGLVCLLTSGFVGSSTVMFSDMSTKSFGYERGHADHPVRPTVVVASVTTIGGWERK